MKSAVAAFIAAAADAIEAGEASGSLSLLITGDEEGHAINGTKAVVAALQAEGERIDHCLVGEPTLIGPLRRHDQDRPARQPQRLADGRGRAGPRGLPRPGGQSRAGHDPASLSALMARRLDDRLSRIPALQPGSHHHRHRQSGNQWQIPRQAKARLNIRFNPTHTGQALADWITAEAAKAGEGFKGQVTTRLEISGEAFLTEPGPFVALAAEAVEAVAGRKPELSTTGGTSDARFIRALCPVLELGLVGATMHAVDEQAPVAEIRQLTDVYRRLIRRYFETFK